MDLDVVFIGTAGSAPSARRALPATLVRRGGDRLLFDCGEGTQRQLLRSIGLVELEEVFITHFHADHWLGLPGMLKTFSLRGRERPLAVHGPPGLRRLFEALRPVIGKTGYEVSLIELEPGVAVERDGYVVMPFPVEHGIVAFGYALVEPGQILGPPRRGRKIVLAGDTAPCEMTKAVAHGADLLVHEATFADEDAERAAETMHSTALAVAHLAAEAEVSLLALTHVSPRYAGGELRDEGRAAFERTIVPHDFDRVEIPFPERGEPVHLRARERPVPAPEPAES